MIAPSGTPAEIVRRLNADLQTALATKELRNVAIAQGFDPSGGSPEQFASAISDEIAKWSRVVKASGFKMD